MSCSDNVAKSMSPNRHSKAILPKDDRTGSVQQGAPVVQWFPNVLVLDWEVVVSILVGVIYPVISAVLELPTCALDCALKLRRLRLLPYPEVWRVYPENVPAAIWEADVR